MPRVGEPCARSANRSVAIVTWPINDPGGINSWGQNFIKGLTALGIPNQTYYATPYSRHGCKPDREVYYKKYYFLKARMLGYGPEHLKGSIAELNTYKLIVMLHPSPHPTRQTYWHPHCEDWVKLYQETRPPKLVVFHDNNWAKTNSWLTLVADHVDAAIAAQKLFMQSVYEYPAQCPKAWSYFPLDLRLGRELQSKVEKLELVIVPTMWVPFKNHRKFLPQLPKIEYPVHLYGNGLEYHTLKNTEPFIQGIRRDCIENRLLNRKSKHSCRGLVPYQHLLIAMAEATLSIDLSYRGYTNMTHFEPLTVGTVSMIERRVVENEHNVIPGDCCIPYDLPTAYEAINEVMVDVDLRQRVVANASKFITRCDYLYVVQDILDWLKREGVVALP